MGHTVVVVVESSPEPNLLIRVLWFLFVGWWLSFWAVLVAIVFQLTIIGIPVSIWIINRIPQITTLKSSRKLQITEAAAGVVVVDHADRPQRPWWQRAIWYVLVGWWAVSIWILLAWIASVTLFLMGLGFWMYGQTGKIQTLRR
jgi:hypothetical protein